MIVSLLSLVLQAAPASAGSTMGLAAQRDAQPLRVWLGSGGTLRRGDAIRVYIQTSEDGHLVVLHRRTDGHIEVLFPANPADDPLVPPGTYEIKRAGARESFVVEEPDGTGLILAALSPASYRFGEFVREASWDPDALAPSWAAVDGEGALTDVIQRMLGDGFFNYDFVTYTVAPLVYAMQDTAPSYPVSPSCVGCSFVGVQVIIAEPVFVCDPFFEPCAAAPRFAQRDRSGESGIRSFDLPMNVIALSLGPGQLATTSAAVPRSPRLVFKPGARSAASGAIEPRTRASVAIHAVPLGAGRGVPVLLRSRAAPSHGAAVRPRELRLTLTPSAVREEPAPVTRAIVQLSAVPRGSAAPALVRYVAAVTPPSGVPVRMAAPWAVHALARSSAVTSAPRTEPTHGMALPGVAWGAAGSRSGVVRVTGRRR